MPKEGVFARVIRGGLVKIEYTIEVSEARLYKRGD